MALTIDATISLPDIIRAAVHRRIQVLTVEVETARVTMRDAEHDAEAAWETAFRLMIGHGDSTHVPASIEHMVKALDEAGIFFIVYWEFGKNEGDDGLPGVVTIEATASSGNVRPLGLQKNLAINYRLGNVTDEVAGLVLIHREAVRVKDRAEQRYNELRALLANPRMAQEMEGEMLASMIEDQAPDIHARIEALATGRPMIAMGE